MEECNDICELCHRKGVELTVHHLVPREVGGRDRDKADLCKACHKHIHALYTNKELGIYLNNIEALRNDEKIMKFIKWVRKQPAGSEVRIKKSNEKKRKCKS